MSEKYTKQGNQTIMTDRVIEHAQKAAATHMVDSRVYSLPPEQQAIHKTCKYISTLPVLPRVGKDGTDNKIKYFGQRTLDAILHQGIYPTCSDIGVVFRGLMVAQGIAASYLEAFHEDYLLDRPNRRSRWDVHVLSRVFPKQGIPLIVDPLPNPRIYAKEYELFVDQKLVIGAQGLDSWDVGVRTFEDLDTVLYRNRAQIWKHFEVMSSEQYQTQLQQYQSRMEDLQRVRETYGTV